MDIMGGLAEGVVVELMHVRGGNGSREHVAQSRRPPRCHHPRRRVIQYPRDGRWIRRGRGVLDTPLSRGMTAVWAAGLRLPHRPSNAATIHLFISCVSRNAI